MLGNPPIAGAYQERGLACRHRLLTNALRPSSRRPGRMSLCTGILRGVYSGSVAGRAAWTPISVIRNCSRWIPKGQDPAFSNTKATGQCWALTSYCPVPGTNVPSNRNYAPGFTATMMLKDLRLAQAAAASAG